MMFRTFSILALGAVLTATSFVARAQDKAGAFDIVGLRLGMTVEEAKAALLAHAADMNIQEQRQYYTYSDGVTHGLRTEPFVAYLDGTRTVKEGTQWGKEGFSLYFSSPPDKQRVFAIVRRQEQTANPPTGQQYRDALTGKYGTPTKADSAGTLKWEFPAGRVNCLVSDMYIPGGKAPILRYVFEGQVPGRFHKREIKDLSQCASILEYKVGLATQPASFVTATMIDVEAAARSELAANEWVAGLKAAAAKARESKGQGPKL